MIDRSYTFANQTRTVIGVMKPEFRFPDERVAFWVPMTIRAAQVTPGGFGPRMVARVAPGTDPAHNPTPRIWPARTMISICSPTRLGIVHEPPPVQQLAVRFRFTAPDEDYARYTVRHARGEVTGNQTGGTHGAQAHVLDTNPGEHVDGLNSREARPYLAISRADRRGLYFRQGHRSAAAEPKAVLPVARRHEMHSSKRC